VLNELGHVFVVVFGADDVGVRHGVVVGGRTVGRVVKGTSTARQYQHPQDAVLELRSAPLLLAAPSLPSCRALNS
jgi:hypothetical protein